MTNKKQQLIIWMKKYKTFATHDVIKWGLQNYYLRADRTKRDLMKQGKIRKLSENEKESFGYHSKDALYRWLGEYKTDGNGQYVIL